MAASFAIHVIGDGISMVRTLPESGRLTLGRGPENDVQIDHHSISRRHVVIAAGPPVSVEDLGSSNGTTVKGVRRGGQETGRLVETPVKPGSPVALAPGDVVSLGSIVLVVRPVGADTPTSTPTKVKATRTPAGVVVADPIMRKVYELAGQVAVGDISVLLLGETGSGKDVLAEAIHKSSPRAGKPLLRLNCAAFSEMLLESELFGYERGAFTGATQAKPGLLETAHGGSVFLDEVGELSPSTQAKLLRVLEDRKVMPVGALKPRPVDVRFIAATNRDLEAEVERGTFRRDLYFRLNGVSLVIPPLRERPREVELLVQSFLEQSCARLKIPVPSVTAEAMGALKAHSWPGNLRELKNVVERAVLLCGGGPIAAEHLPGDKLGKGVRASTRPPEPAAPNLRDEVEALERQRIVHALEQCAGNQTQASKLLGMPRRTLVKRLAAYGIARPRSK